MSELSRKCDKWRGQANLFPEGREDISISTTVVRAALNPSVPVSLGWGVPDAGGESPTMGGREVLIPRNLGAFVCLRNVPF